MLASLYFSVTMVPSVCQHGWKPSSNPERIPAAEGHTAYLLCFAVVPLHLGNFLSALVCCYLFQKHSPEHVSALGAEEALGGHHTHPIRCSLSPQPFMSTLSCRHLVWKLTMITAARACSPSVGWGRDNRQRTNLRRRERAPPPPQVHEQGAHVYRSICFPTE